jgi:hypothetical protein
MSQTAPVELIDIGPIAHREIDDAGRLAIPHPSHLRGPWQDSPDRDAIALCVFFALILDVAQKNPDPSVGHRYRFRRATRNDARSPGTGEQSGWGLYASIPLDWNWIESHASFGPGTEDFLLREPTDSAWPAAIGPGVAWRNAGERRPEAFDAIVSGQDPHDDEWAAVGFVQGQPWSGVLPDRVRVAEERLVKRHAAEERRARKAGSYSGPWR